MRKIKQINRPFIVCVPRADGTWNVYDCATSLESAKARAVYFGKKTFQVRVRGKIVFDTAGTALARTGGAS